MRRILQPFRFVGIFLSILVYLAHMSLVWLCVRNRWRRIALCNRLLQDYSRWGLWVLNVKVNPIGRDQLASMPNALFVGNHLSYLDVLVICSQQPACFVTSTEIRDTPFLGQICIMAGCLFVERRNKMNIKSEVAEISEGLRHGLNVAIFPEATSTNGEQILRFRRPLYVSAIEATRPVVPFCLNYRRVGGEPVSYLTRDKVFWYGDMDFAPHLWALAGSGGVEVDLHFLTPMTTTAEDDPTELAARSQAYVEGVFRPVRKDDGPVQGPSPG